MTVAYREDEEVQKIVRQIGALQLVQPSEWQKCVALINFAAPKIFNPSTAKPTSIQSIKGDGNCGFRFVISVYYFVIIIQCMCISGQSPIA